MVGQRDVIAPYVILPFFEAQHAAENAAGVQPHPHVQLHVRLLANRPADRTEILLVIVVSRLCSQTDLQKGQKYSLSLSHVRLLANRPAERTEIHLVIVVSFIPPRPPFCFTSVCLQTDPQKRTARTEKDDTLLLSSPLPSSCLSALKHTRRKGQKYTLLLSSLLSPLIQMLAIMTWARVVINQVLYSELANTKPVNNKDYIQLEVTYLLLSFFFFNWSLFSFCGYVWHALKIAVCTESSSTRVPTHSFILTQSSPNVMRRHNSEPDFRLRSQEICFALI